MLYIHFETKAAICLCTRHLGGCREHQEALLALASHPAPFWLGLPHREASVHPRTQLTDCFSYLEAGFPARVLLVAVPQSCLQCSPMACPVFSPSPAGPEETPWTDPKLLSSPHVIGNGQWCPLVSPARSAHPTGMQWDGAEGRTWLHSSYPGLLASATSCCAAPCCRGCTTNRLCCTQ